MRNFELYSTAFAAVLILSLSACVKEDVVNDERGGETVIPVEVAELETTLFREQVSLQGKIRAYQEVRLTAEIPGRIEGLPFDVGQHVGKGQIVVRLNARMAKAQLAQAQASVRLATQSHERNIRLLDKKLATPQQVEMSQAQLDQASAAQELAKIALGKALLRSPIEGVIAMRSMNMGEVANPGQPLLHIVNVQKVFVDLNLPERDISLLKEGQPVDVHLPALGTHLLKGVIHRIGVMAQRKTRTFSVEVLLENKDGMLRPGMLASVKLTRRFYENAMVIPRDAVMDGVSSKSVYVLQGDVVHTRPVILGPVRDRFALVKSGLNAGEKLVVLGHQQVVNGQKVKVTQSKLCCKAAMTQKIRAEKRAVESGDLVEEKDENKFIEEKK